MDDPQGLIRALLHRISVREVGPGPRYQCARCHAEWPFRDRPSWWLCPTAGCSAWMEWGGPAVTEAMRVLGGSRPVDRATISHGGRPQIPKVPPSVIRERFDDLFAATGHYPADKDLADEYGVSESTVRNYRRKGYLPQRPSK